MLAKSLQRFARCGRPSFRISTRTKSSSKNQESTFATATQPRPKFQEDPELPKKEKFASRTSSVGKFFEVPLSESLPGLPAASYAEVPKTGDPYETKVSTLPNGIRIATAPHFGEFCTIGVLIDAGSRDTFIYAASCHNSGLEAVLHMIADCVLRPSISSAEIDAAKSIIRFDLEDMDRNPNPDQILTDLIHRAAFQNNTLGLPKFCPIENIDKIDRNVLFSYLKQHYTPQRMVVAGVGVSHEDMLEATRQYFGEAAVWDQQPNLTSQIAAWPGDAVAQYTGGIVKVEKDLSDVALGPTPMPELAHFVLGLNSSSYKDSDFVPFCVLNSLMGGGGSFSAGGPGKGMYTRLYLNVLNRFHWMYNATSYNHVYADAGLFCIHASADPKQLWEVVNVIVQEFINMAGNVQKDELDRAKTQLKSMLLMQLEQRPVMFEDVGRQVLGHGARKSPVQYMEEIAAVEAKDIRRIAERLLSSKPAVVGYGNTAKLPDHNRIEQAISKRDPTCLKPSRMFSFKK